MLLRIRHVRRQIAHVCTGVCVCVCMCVCSCVSPTSCLSLSLCPPPAPSPFVPSTTHPLPFKMPLFAAALGCPRVPPCSIELMIIRLAAILPLRTLFSCVPFKDNVAAATCQRAVQINFVPTYKRIIKLARKLQSTVTHSLPIKRGTNCYFDKHVICHTCFKSLPYRLTIFMACTF